MTAGNVSDTAGFDSAELETLDLGELRKLWRHHFPADPPRRMSRELMRRAIAYRVQEQRFGGLGRNAKAKLKAYASGRSRNPGGTPAKPRITVKPGTQLVRQWNGRMHTVVALNDGGFSYRDQRYRSLSRIAGEITGTKWSGPAFFGLKAAAGASAECDDDRTEARQ